jgi:uncharacterized protein YkwD
MLRSTLVKVFFFFSLSLLMLLFLSPGDRQRGRSGALLANEATAAGGAQDYREMENKVKVLVDAERAKLGLAPLDMNETLRLIAREHSQDMASRNYFSHVSPEGIQPADRITAAGLSYGAVAENIASNRGLPDPAAFAVQSWMTSPGHRNNILDAMGGGFTQTGVGIAKRSDGTFFFTQIFFKSR